MSISAAYATPAQYRAALDKTDAAADAIIQVDLAAVSRYLDSYLGRFFSVDAVPVERMYAVARDTPELLVDDVAFAPTDVRVDTGRDNSWATGLTVADYELLPRNAPREPEPKPWTCISLVPWSPRLLMFPAGARVRVTARFGWPAVPPAIERATIYLTAILRLETPHATQRIPELGEAVEASPMAQKIIRQLAYQYRLVKYG